MTDYRALADEIALPAYEGMTDAEIAAALNAVTVPVVRDVPTWEARGLLLSTGEWGGIVMLARSEPSDAVPAEAIAAAITAEDTLRLTTELQVSHPGNLAAVEMLLGGLVQAGVLSATTRDALLALSSVTTSRAAQLGLGEVRPGDVATARATV